jgi:hypothetical protein
MSLTRRPGDRSSLDLRRDRQSGMEAICTSGVVGSLTDLISLLSIYNCPATHIRVANKITNIALANCVASLILLHQISPVHAGIRQGERQTSGLSSTGLGAFQEMRPPAWTPVPAGYPQFRDARTAIRSASDLIVA